VLAVPAERENLPELASEPQDLGRAVVSGFGWKVVAELLVQTTRILVLLLLARLLSPREFGIAGEVLAFSVFVPILSDLALGAALIHRKDITEADRSTVFWATVALGACFMTLGIGLSWPLASFFGEPTLQPLFAVFSVSFLVASLGATPMALLTRSMNFRALELRIILSTLGGAAVAVAVALLDGGAWALVTQALTTSTLSAVLLWAQCPWRPRRQFSMHSLRRLGSYSGSVFGAHFLLQLGPSLQNLLIGRLLGAPALGTFVVAQNIVLLPFNRIAAPIQEVLFPAFSRLQDEPRTIAAAWQRVTRIVGAVAIGSLAGLAIVADDFVHAVLGDRWEGAIPLLRILAIMGVVQALQRLNLSILQARGRTRSLLPLSVLAVVAVVLAVLLGDRSDSIEHVAVWLAIFSSLVQLAFMAVTAAAVETTLRESLRPLTRVTAAAAVMAGAVAIAHEAVDGLASPAVRLLIEVAVGIATFLPATALLDRAVVAEVRALWGRLAGRRAPSRVAGPG
jgi:O-antigen/teichoic acid export membrane protein